MNRAAFVAAGVAAIIGFALLWLYMERLKDETSGGPPVAVLMATMDVPLGGILTQEMIGTRNLPSGYVEERHIRAADAERIIGVRVSMGVKANESLLWTDLATTAQQRRDLSGLVGDGMRAVTIRADAASAFGGLLRPGDRVDSLLTMTREDNREKVTIPLLQNILVLAVGADVGATTSRRQAQRRTYQQVTMSETVDQAQHLTFSGSIGDLTLILRNPDDITILEELPETTIRDVIEIERRRRATRREPQAPAPTPHIPEQIQGSRR